MHTEITLQAEELARYFRAAAEQRRLLEPRRADRRRVAEGKTVLHAVDADVVKLFTNPFENAVRTDRRHYGYGEVFPDDERVNAIGVGRVLAHFIFHQLGGKNSPPLLLLPPIDQELREVFRSVMRDAMSEGIKAREQATEIQKLSAQIAKIEDKTERTRRLVEAAPDLFRFLTGSRGARAEMERFSRLASDKRIAPLEQALEQQLHGIETFQHAFQPPRGLAERVRFIDRSRFWYGEIMKKPRAKNPSRIQDDALMLARLEWINTQLGNDTRLVLITGDHSIHEAARGYIPENEKRCFADLWLRHPRSYLAEPEVLSPESDDNTVAETKFIEWLDTFLGKLELTGPDYMTALDKLLAEQPKDSVEKASKVVESHPDILDEFKMRWSAYTCRAVLAHDFVDAPETSDNEQVAQLVRTITSQLTNIEDVLNKEVTNAWSAVFDAAIEAGFLFARQHETRRARNPPVLFFESLNTAREFVRKVLATEQQDRIADFVQNMDELRKEDPSGYTYTLAFGMLFAAQRAWAVAAILAKRALELAQANHSKDNITGREAYYLQAVAKRHQIRKPSELDDIADLLDKAESCLTEERKTRKDLLKDDYRFSSERIALDICYRLFQHFSGSEIPDSIQSLNEIESGIKELIGKNAISLSPNTSEHKRWVARNVERRLLTNLFMVALLQAKGSQPFPQELLPYFDRFKLSVEGDITETEPIPRTFFVDSVYCVTQWWRESNSSEKKILRNEVQYLLGDEKIERNIVMPYDHPRFAYLRNFVTTNIGIPTPSK